MNRAQWNVFGFFLIAGGVFMINFPSDLSLLSNDAVFIRIAIYGAIGQVSIFMGIACLVCAMLETRQKKS